MFRTRQEVDKHVNSSLRSLNNESERCMRGYAFAKLYFNVGDYEHAVRYVNSYLSVKPKSPEGHNLLGKALEKLGRKQSALEAYRTSLQLDPNQNNLVLKVCDLLAQDEIDIDSSGARYFCDLAQSLDPKNPIVTNLKEKLISSNGQDPNQVSEFLLKELENRPTDVNLRVRLLKNLLENNKVKEAYKHAFDIEQKKLDMFDDNISWYEIFAEVLVRYQKDASISSQLTWQFWFLSTSVLEKLALLSLSEHTEHVKTTTDYVTTVFNFDQSFLKASENVDSCPDKILLKEFLNHYEGQVNFHFSVLAFKQAKKDLINFKEVENFVLPVLFTAYNLPVPDTQGVWFSNLPENRRLLVAGWHKEAAFRRSQTGNILLGLAKDRKNIVIEKATQYSTGMWREQIFKKLFVKRDQQLKTVTSFFNSSALEPVLKLPDVRELITYNEVAQMVNPGSLHHYIWLANNYQDLADFTLKSFDGLQYSVKNLNNCAAETLNILDVQSFIYCATLCAQSKAQNADHSLTYFHQNRPTVLPVSITATLGTLNQVKFLSAAYKMYKNEYTLNMGEIRLILIKGIEVVRCVGNHGLDVKLLVNLATIFADRVGRLTKHTEIEANSARAELYWKTALPLLEKLKNEHAVVYPSNRMFELKGGKDISQDEILTYIEKAKLFMGVQLMKKEEYEKAMNLFEGLKDPYASFYQSQIYKAMADSKTSQRKENVTSEMRSQNIILLSRARDCLYLTLDRLREPSQDRNHPLNAQLGTEIEKTERLLSRIDPDCSNRNECDGMSDENVSDDSIGEHYLSSYTHHASFANVRDSTAKNDALQLHSTPLRFNVSKREARPSPERLDAQIRQLMASKDMAMSNIVEQNKMMVELQQSLTDEIRGFKDAVKNLTSATEQRVQSFTGNFEDVKKMVDDLTHSVDERLQSVTDMVQEMRRELNEIKKDQNKNTQLSVEDLYDLDPDYNSLDYNLGPNMTNNQAQNLSSMNSLVNNMYPNYPRLPQAPPVANLAAYAGQGLYPGLYPGLPYPHLPLGLQAGLPGLPFLPPPADQQQLSHLPNLTGLPQPLNPNLSQLTQMASQALSNIQSPAKESPKPQTFPPNNASFGPSAAASISQSMSIKDSPNPKTSIFSSSGYNQTGFLGQSLSTGGFNAASATSSSTVPVSRAPPVNVVITSSDPLPSFKTTTSQPILSVTIPPQHIKGATIPKALPNQGAHNYQIPMPVTTTVASTPSILNQPSPFSGGQSISSSISSPIVSSAQTASPNVSLGIHIEKTLDKTFSTPQKTDTSLNKSNVSNISSGSLEEYDPRPDFQPIIPLPDEVPVTTGEEKETELLCQRAKLFRLVTTNGGVEWKERGIGNIKILLNPETGKVRILMRRDQVHKICANHFLTKDMILSPMINNDKAYIWAAQDFADEQLTLEKFCVRFKTSDEAKKFAEAFELAKSKIQESKTNETVKPTESVEVKPPTSSTAQSTPTNLGGFKFMSTPTFKPKEEVKPVELVKETAKEPEKVSPFASFTFGSKPHSEPPKNLFSGSTLTFEPPKLTAQPATKTNTPDKTSNDDEVDEYVPTQEFKPVVEKLPDLVEVKTGEENAEVLFDERSKLFRWDTSGEKPEWKERGLGNIKILKEDTIRLVMRREQVHKVCLNHQVLKNMPFNKNSADAKAVVWHAQDFSEGVLKAEMFTARFKNEEIANRFLATLQKLQTSLDESNQISGKHHKAEAQPKTGFGDKFKPAKGSWECKNCYVNNDSKTNTCMACDTPKVGSSPKKAEPTFSFTAKPSTDSTKTEVTITPVSSGWGNQFKPAAGSWECKTCLVSNAGDKTKCASCETPKDGAESTTQSTGLKGISLDTGGQKFTFGMPSSQTTTQEQPTPKFTFSATSAAPKLDANTVLSGFGDSFKPKPGSWDCKACYVRNEPTSLYCLSCETPKDDTVPKKESTNIKGVNLETPGLKFSFGMPATTQPPAATSFGFGTTDATKTAFSWKPKVENASSGSEEKEKSNSQVGEPTLFSSPKKAEFEFKPRSPRRISSGQGDESDASYVEEEEANVQFKPVIPLPDIVEVKTGEENEEVLYTHRAKLYRFVSGEWKERGIGDVKILKDNVSGKLRVVMRREQVFKICLNHWLTKDVEYLSKDEKTWLFHAADFSEGELSRDQFCLRFKSSEVAVEFKKAIDNALAIPDTVKDETPKKVEGRTEPDSDVEFVSETQVTPEEEQEALKLMLPPKFMAYRQKPDCVCEQCMKDEEYLKDLFGKSSTNEKPAITSANTSVFFTPTSSLSTPSTAESVFGTPPITRFSFGSPTGEQFGIRPPKSESLRQLLQKSSLTPQATDQKTTNLFSLNAEKASPTSNSANVTPKAEVEKDVKKEESSNVSSTSVTPVGSSLQKSSSGLFTQKSDNIFRITGTASSGSASPSIFGDSTGNIFSTPKDGSTPNLFGSKSIFGSGSDSSKNLFSSSGNLFSLNKASPATGNIFGTAANISSNTSLFGSSPGLNTNQPQASATPLFGASSQLNIFGTSANSGNIFGQGLFGNKAGPKVTDANLTFGSTTTNLKDKDEVILKADSNLSFANLAQASKTETAFTPKDNSEVPFAFLGAGAPVFGSLKKEKTPSKTKEQLNKTQEGSDNEEVEGADHDPHFEPIVPLPDAIVVTTGEEEENVVFNERAKLFRYDNSTKEWKERGVGELKVLFHPENKTYRLLLRREQVHKVVLNQRITSDLELQPMSTSDKAWVWAGMNYSEDETKLEKLAVKFKNTALAQAFKKCIDETVLKAAEIQANRSQLSDLVPTTVQDLHANDEESHDDYGENEDYDDEEEDDDDEDDERTVMFNKRCTLSEDIGGNWQQVCMGDLQVYYDPELFTARICIISDNGEIVSNTIIGVNTVLEINGKECTWKSVEWADSNDPHWRTLKATFSSDVAAEEFHSNYLEGVNYAHEVGIADELPPEVDTESDH